MRAREIHGRCWRKETEGGKLCNYMIILKVQNIKILSLMFNRKDTLWLSKQSIGKGMY